MSKTIVNLAIPIVTEEIERILESYPHHPYQQAFANPDMRQALVAYVLCRHPSLYAAVDEGPAQEECLNPDALHGSLEQPQHLEDTIRAGIEQILTEQSEQLEHQIPEEVEPNNEPSHWFG